MLDRILVSKEWLKVIGVEAVCVKESSV